MKAIILAAGVGSRMGEYTKERPKCLLDIGDETILDREIRLLKENGFSSNDIIIMGGYRADLLSGRDALLIVNEDYLTTDNSYTLGLALEHIDDDVIILDGDLVFEGAILNDLLHCSYDNVVMSQVSTDLSESTGILTDANGCVLDIGKHVIDSGYVYISILKVCKHTLLDFKRELLNNTMRNTWYTAPLTKILPNHTFINLTTEHKWHEVDDIEDYEATKELFNLK